MRRRAGLLWVIGMVVPLVMASTAYGQGATLTVTPSTVAPGQDVTVTGTGFTASNAHITGGVNLRLDTRDAPVMANTSVTSQGTLTQITFPVPANTAPGEHLLIGTQVTVRGRHVFGAPGRAKLRVTGSAVAAASTSGGPGGLPAPPLAAAILALLALAAGSVLTVRRLRTPAGGTQPHVSR